VIGAAALPITGLLTTPAPAADPGLGAVPLDVEGASGVPDEGPVTLSIFLFKPPATAEFAEAGPPATGGLAPFAVGFGFGPTFPP